MTESLASLPTGQELEDWAAEHLGAGVVLLHMFGDASTRDSWRAPSRCFAGSGSASC